MWISLKDKEPDIKDLPFITYNVIRYESEIWDDVDWFSELTDEDKSDWTHWLKLPKLPHYLDHIKSIKDINTKDI